MEALKVTAANCRQKEMRLIDKKNKKQLCRMACGADV